MQRLLGKITEKSTALAGLLHGTGAPDRTAVGACFIYSTQPIRLAQPYARFLANRFPEPFAPEKDPEPNFFQTCADNAATLDLEIEHAVAYLSRFDGCGSDQICEDEVRLLATMRASKEKAQRIQEKVQRLENNRCYEALEPILKEFDEFTKNLVGAQKALDPEHNDIFIDANMHKKLRTLTTAQIQLSFIAFPLSLHHAEKVTEPQTARDSLNHLLADKTLQTLMAQGHWEQCKQSLITEQRINRIILAQNSQDIVDDLEMIIQESESKNSLNYSILQVARLRDGVRNQFQAHEQRPIFLNVLAQQSRQFTQVRLKHGLQGQAGQPLPQNVSEHVLPPERDQIAKALYFSHLTMEQNSVNRKHTQLSNAFGKMAMDVICQPLECFPAEPPGALPARRRSPANERRVAYYRQHRSTLPKKRLHLNKIFNDKINPKFPWQTTLNLMRNIAELFHAFEDVYLTQRVLSGLRDRINASINDPAAAPARSKFLALSRINPPEIPTAPKEAQVPWDPKHQPACACACASKRR